MENDQCSNLSQNLLENDEICPTIKRNVNQPIFSDKIEIKYFPIEHSTPKESLSRCPNCTALSNSQDSCCTVCGRWKVKGYSRYVATDTTQPWPWSFSRRLSAESIDLIRTVEESEAAEQYQHILAHCKINNTVFIDTHFPPNDKSLGQIIVDEQTFAVPSDPSQDLSPIFWARPLEICDFDDNFLSRHLFNTWTIYSNPRATDIMQGRLGDCWFLSALAVVAERKDLLEHLIISREFNYYGIYQIRLCVDGQWRVILIDDHLPCDSNRRLVFSKAKRRQLWVPLLEKALAKLHATYGALSRGRSLEGLATLTGAPCVSVSLEHDEQNPDVEPEPNILWAKFLSAKEAGFLMGASCGSGSRPVNFDEYYRMGLQPRHAYSVLDLKETTDNRRLVLLRNPWGRATTNTIANHKATPRFHISQFHNNDGLLWMPFNDFCRYFDSVDVCRLKYGCKELRLEVPLPNHSSPDELFCVYLHMEQTTDVDFVLYQRGLRNETPLKHGNLDLCIFLFKSDVYGQMGDLVKASDRFIKPFVVLNACLEKGTYVIICTSFVHWNLELNETPKAVLAIHGLNKLSAQLSSAPPHILADALITFIKKFGQPHSELNDVMLYYSPGHKFSGIAIVVENNNPNFSLVVKCDCSESTNVVSTRASLVTADVILPKRCQLILILTHFECTVAFYIKHKLAYTFTKEPYLGVHWPQTPYSSHQPPLEPKTRALHEPRPF